MAVETTQELLTPREVARTLRQSVPTVYRKIAAGEIEAYRLGDTGPLRVPAEALKRHLRRASAPGGLGAVAEGV
jgi:excisionase family DNA binding protein